ncbi:hypothetical protein [Xanthomonas arboricola]|nr:hypothetical protein [Xanthomonas arboricola]
MNDEFVGFHSANRSFVVNGIYVSFSDPQDSGLDLAGLPGAGA